MSYDRDLVVAAYEARTRGDVEFLLELLKDTDWLARSAAAKNLGELRSRRAVPALVRCLQAADEGLRISALKALAKIGDRSVVEDVYEIASGTDTFGVRSTAAETLGRLGDRRAARLLGAMLHETDNPYPGSFRKWAARTLVEIRGVDAISDLNEARRHAGPLGRLRLARAIRALRSVNDVE